MGWDRVKVSFCVFFISWAASADWTKIKSAEFELPNPPKEGSKKYQKDFEVLHDFQESRTPADCALGKKQLYPDFDVLYGGEAGYLSAEQVKLVRPLMSRVFKFTERVSGKFKGDFNRPRPFSVDETLTPCIAKPSGSKAYPSSHAAVAAAGACVLSELFPSQAKELEEYGASLGELRVVVGVHHPSDVEAGQSLAAQICERLLKETDFNSELAKLKSKL